ncbi:adhesion G protein-coupled receptor B1-like isoform X2 [Xenia sp. Carnegie-2017]|uniref:adhesion G protein-coupled receptor B1-like isoform X2 n=1 Tax=Xenia sp. Carnegie-2017 TaxID=2897299 RepID=UPI001F0450E0|nr:adhesion G protein-coupled receptor B1-like isoform X2 [Xenia sp. Carnegie-2017]
MAENFLLSVMVAISYLYGVSDHPFLAAGLEPSASEILLHYDFEKTVDKKVLDQSIYQRNATIYDQYLNLTSGKCNNGVLLNHRPLRFIDWSSGVGSISSFNITIAAWIYLNEFYVLKAKEKCPLCNRTIPCKKFADDRTLFSSFMHQNINDIFFKFEVGKDRYLRWYFLFEKPFKLHANKSRIKLGVWQHVAVSFTFFRGQTNCTFFINGTEFQSKSLHTDKYNKTLMNVRIGPLGRLNFIGTSGACGVKPFSGVIDDLYVLNISMSSEEIRRLMMTPCDEKTNSSVEPTASEPIASESSSTTSSIFVPEIVVSDTEAAKPVDKPVSKIQSTVEFTSKISPTGVSSSQIQSLVEVTPTTSSAGLSTVQSTVDVTSKLSPLSVSSIQSTIEFTSEISPTSVSSIQSTVQVTPSALPTRMSTELISGFGGKSGRAILEQTRKLEKDVLTIARNALNGNQSITYDNASALLLLSAPSAGFTFPSMKLKGRKKVNESISFPDDLVKTNSGEQRYFVGISYNNLHKFLSKNITKFRQKPNTHLTLTSNIIAAAVYPPLKTNLTNPIKITFDHKISDDREPVCSFWNHSIRTGNKISGQWSSEGCEFDKNESTPGHTVCRCNHLTNFALLLQRRTDSYVEQPLSLKIITIVGCSLSILACLLCFIMFLTLKKRDIRHYLHINLTFAIAVAQILLLFGVNKTKNEGLCKAMAISLHYFYLVAFMFMLCEGVHLAILIETAFLHGDVKLPVYLIASWGLPSIIVGITVGVRYDNYGGNQSCFISAHEGTIYAFFGPFAFVLLINFVIIIMVLRQVIKKTSLPVSSKTASKFDIVRATIRSLVILFPVMGLTWIFAILYFGFQTRVFEYLFAIFSSLQGFFIFLLQYALNTENRLAFLRATKRWQLSMTSSFSHSTNNTKRSSLMTKTSSHNEKEALNTMGGQCKLTVYNSLDPGHGDTINSRTTSTFI